MSQFSDTSAGRASQRMAKWDEKRLANRFQRNDERRARERTTLAARRNSFNQGVQDRLARSNKFRQEAAGVPAGTGINTLENRQQFVVGGTNPTTGKLVTLGETQEAMRRGQTLPEREAVMRQAESRRKQDQAALDTAKAPMVAARENRKAAEYQADAQKDVATARIDSEEYRANLEAKLRREGLSAQQAQAEADRRMQLTMQKNQIDAAQSEGRANRGLQREMIGSQASGQGAPPPEFIPELGQFMVQGVPGGSTVMSPEQIQRNSMLAGAGSQEDRDEMLRQFELEDAYAEGNWPEDLYTFATQGGGEQLRRGFTNFVTSPFRGGGEER